MEMEFERHGVGSTLVTLIPPYKLQSRFDIKYLMATSGDAGVVSLFAGGSLFYRSHTTANGELSCYIHTVIFQPGTLITTNYKSESGCLCDVGVVVREYQT
jgi:hypothetical protein